MASKGTDADSPLPIEVWAEIQAITELLCWCESSYRFVPGEGDILVKEHPPERLRALRAIFEVYGDRIKKELPEDLRGVGWVAVCDPTVGIYVQTHADFIFSGLRCYQFEHLHEIAARVVAKHNAAALAGVDSAATHGPGFRDVTWCGTKHIFTPKQAACIRVLWEAWEQGNPWVADGTVLEKASVGDKQRLRDVFKDHAAWTTMIAQGPQQDLHGLQEISEKI
jgi:hypothetical protein